MQVMAVPQPSCYPPTPLFHPPQPPFCPLHIPFCPQTLLFTPQSPPFCPSTPHFTPQTTPFPPSLPTVCTRWLSRLHLRLRADGQWENLHHGGAGRVGPREKGDDPQSGAPGLPGSTGAGREGLAGESPHGGLLGGYLGAVWCFLTPPAVSFQRQLPGDLQRVAAGPAGRSARARGAGDPPGQLSQRGAARPQPAPRPRGFRGRGETCFLSTDSHQISAFSPRNEPRLCWDGGGTSRRPPFPPPGAAVAADSHCQPLGGTDSTQ